MISIIFNYIYENTLIVGAIIVAFVIIVLVIANLVNRKHSAKVINVQERKQINKIKNAKKQTNRNIKIQKSQEKLNTDNLNKVEQIQPLQFSIRQFLERTRNR